MSNYAKRIVILSEASGNAPGSARGVVNVERDGSRTTARFTVFGLPRTDRGRYYCGIVAKNARFQKYDAGTSGAINLTMSLDSATDLDSPLVCAVALTDGETVTPVLIGCNGLRRVYFGEIADKFVEPKPKPEPRPVPNPEANKPDSEPKPEPKPELKPEPEPKPEPKSKSEPQFVCESEPEPQVESPAPTDEYISEQEDYTAHTQTQERKRGAFETETESSDDGELNAEAVFGGETEYCDGAVAAENYYPKGFGQTGFTLDPLIEINRPDPSKILNGKPPQTFYESVAAQLEELFTKFPAEERLAKRLSGTRWVKVDYNNNGKYYIVGLIGEEPVKYICYGVPADFSPVMPEELGTDCQWLPLDENNPQGEGYWLMYQSAETGESVKLEII